MADYLHMSDDSVWHVADRCLALALTLLEVWRLIELWQHDFHHTTRYRPLQLVRSYSSGELAQRVAVVSYYCLLYTLALVGALASFLASSQAQAELDRDGFVFWHSMWHLYPIAVSLLTLYDWNMGQEGGGSVLQFKVGVRRRRNNQSNKKQL